MKRYLKLKLIWPNQLLKEEDKKKKLSKKKIKKIKPKMEFYK